MGKFRVAALNLIVFAFLFFFLRTFSEYHFYTIEQNQLFQLSSYYIVDKLTQPGGLAMVISGWLVQFFIVPNAGAAIMAGVLTALAALLGAILRRIDPESRGVLWAWLPVLFLLFIQWDFNYMFQGTVAFGMMLVVLYLALGIKRFMIRWIVSMLATVILFGLAGPIALLFALSMLIYEILGQTSRGYYAIALPLFAGLLGFLSVNFSIQGEYRYAFLPDGYFYFRLVPGRLIYYSWIALCIAIAVTCLCKNQKSPVGKKRLLLDGAQVLLMVLIFWKGFDLYGEQNSYRLKMMEYYARTEQWDRILDACKEPTTNPLYLCYQNMALARKGLLADDAFKYSQQGPRGLVVPWNKSTAISALLSDVYFTMGNVAAAQQMAFESNIGALCDGNPRMMRRLVQTNLIYGAYPVAEKYIAVLENTLFYKDWATAHRKFLYDDAAVEQDPLLGYMRKNLQSDNHLSQAEGFYTDLIRIAGQNPSNKAAFQYVGVALLLAKDVTGFKRLVETYYGTELMPSLPVSYQEAVIILSEKDPDYWKRFGVSESIVGRFADYKRQVLAGRNNSNALPGLMFRSYGNTYWYYYMFR